MVSVGTQLPCPRPVAANAFLDAFAHHRRSLGLPVLTIDWGRLDEVGYVARHAEAKHVTVQMGRTNGYYFVAIEDDGRGFDTSQPEPSGHFGLRVMQARAAHIGGELLIESVPGAGSRVTLTFPNGDKP